MTDFEYEYHESSDLEPMDREARESEEWDYWQQWVNAGVYSQEYAEEQYQAWLERQ